ncbi:LysE family transporter [Bacteroidia bacterium]|jgi:threonine/homoserine/homoserine lactone efflux protein|nr:LysE family transporter [Bacteroidia bacterium]
MAILEGLILGLLTAFLLGPVFFTLLKNAIQFGRNAGMATALGIIASDVIVISICFFATDSLLESIKTEPIVKLIGASILLFMGIRFMFWPSSNIAKSTKTNQSGYLGYVIQGFLVNGVNPFVFVVWIGYITIGKNSYSGNELILFLAFILVGILVTDIVKSFLAHRIRPYLRPVYLKKAYQIIGFVLVGFALRLIMMAVK